MGGVVRVDIGVPDSYTFPVGNSMKMVRRIKKINLCNNYVTGITGKLIICTLLCKKNYMVIYIRIDFVDI